MILLFLKKEKRLASKLLLSTLENSNSYVEKIRLLFHQRKWAFDIEETKRLHRVILDLVRTKEHEKNDEKRFLLAQSNFFVQSIDVCLWENEFDLVISLIKSECIYFVTLKRNIVYTGIQRLMRRFIVSLRHSNQLVFFQKMIKDTSLE